VMSPEESFAHGPLEATRLQRGLETDVDWS